MKTAHVFSLLLGAAFLATGDVQAQATKDVVPLGPSAKAFTVRDKRIKQENIISPDLQLRGTAKPFKPETWVNIEVELEVHLQAERARDVLGIGKNDLYMGPVEVSFYVHVKDPNPTAGKGNILLLKKDITYTDVPINKGTCFNVMLSPISVANLTGGTGSLKIERMGYEIKFRDEVIYRNSTDKPKGDWWNASSTSVTMSGKYPLLNKDETPFAMLWWDRYPPIQKLDSTTTGNVIRQLQTPVQEPPATPPSE